MTLTQLRYIIAIVDTGSMNEAAKSLFISQPSLSLAVKELEKEIGTRLFKRSNRGVSVTQEGMEFLSYARQVVEQYQLMESRYIEKKNIKKKFGVSMQHYTFAVNAFVEMVKQFGMDEYEFAVRETKTYEVIKDVKDFHSEIGILYLNEFNKKVLSKMLQESGLEFHPLLECGIYVYMWKGHPLAKREKITLEEVASSVYMSSNYFSSYFRKVTNISFSDYVTRMRINHARELLRETDKNVTEIAMECGFNNISNFYRLYKKHVGKPPKDEKQKKQ